MGTFANGDDIATVQRMLLATVGFPLVINGLLDSPTYNAIQTFQVNNGLPMAPLPVGPWSQDMTTGTWIVPGDPWDAITRAALISKATPTAGSAVVSYAQPSPPATMSTGSKWLLGGAALAAAGLLYVALTD